MVEQIDWIEFEPEDDADDSTIKEYDITASPNDFNIKTIFDFIDSGAVKIPGFQRNYVWDIKRASKLIESIIVGLPIPQIFLYEESRNNFLVIDGQQRLMSIYYFIKKRFPKSDRRVEIRKIFDEYGTPPNNILYDDSFFDKFNLQLPSPIADKQNKFDTLNYETLGDHKLQFDLRPVRNIIIRQNDPKDDSSIYEIFNRLNSGGINLTPQEIRASLYHSDFYMLLDRLNLHEGWRRILGAKEPDLHRKDVEILLRGFALLIEGKDNYRPSMTRFLNGFSKKAKRMSAENIAYCEKIFNSFVESCNHLEDDAFLSARNKFNISTFDAVFSAICIDAYNTKSTILPVINSDKLSSLKANPAFIKVTQVGTANADNVIERIKIAKEILV